MFQWFQAKNTLSELQIPYTDISVDKYEAAREEMKQRTGKATVPQIFFNSHHVGGNAEFQKLVLHATFLFVPLQLRIQDLPDEGANLFFDQIFPKPAWNRSMQPFVRI